MAGGRGSGVLNDASIKRKMELFRITGIIVNVLFVNLPAVSERSCIVKVERAGGNTLPSGLTGYILST